VLGSDQGKGNSALENIEDGHSPNQRYDIPTVFQQNGALSERDLTRVGTGAAAHFCGAFQSGEGGTDVGEAGARGLTRE